MPRKCSPEPPSWWKPSLYDFVNDMPVDGWVWEFYRRAVLKENLIDLPVDAMNPKPKLERRLKAIPRPQEEDGWAISHLDDAGTEDRKLASENWNLYLHWADSKWRNRKPVGIPPSVICDEVNQLTVWFGRHYGARRKVVGRAEVRKPPRLITLHLDVDRRDSVIKKDFEAVFTELRKKYPEPERVSPRISDWVNNRILEVWDLREFKLSWKRIAKDCPPKHVKDLDDPLRLARNAYDSAVNYIQGGHWQKLALYTDSE